MTVDRLRSRGARARRLVAVVNREAAAVAPLAAAALASHVRARVVLAAGEAAAGAGHLLAPLERVVHQGLGVGQLGADEMVRDPVRAHVHRGACVGHQARLAEAAVALAAAGAEEEVGDVHADLEVGALRARDEALVCLQALHREPIQVLAALRVIEEGLKAHPGDFAAADRTLRREA